MKTTATQLPAQLSTVQSLRALAILLVMFLHLRDLERIHLPVPILPNWADIGHAGVDLFFVISGFIMVFISHGCPSSWGASLNFLYHRWTRIYPTYWVWFLVTLMIYLITPYWLRLAPGQVPHLLESFFLIPTWTLQLVPVTWTLKYELYFYLFFSFLILFLPRGRLVMFALWVAYMLAGQIYCYRPPNITCSKNLFLTMNPLAFDFIFGALVASYYLLNRKCQPYLFLLAGVGLLIGGMTYYVLSGISLEDNDWYRVILFGLPSAIFLLGCVEGERYPRMIMPAWLVTLGNASYSIYLSHTLLFELLFRAFNALPPLPPTVVIFAIFFSSIGVGLMSYRWVEKPLINQSRRLFMLCSDKIYPTDKPVPRPRNRLKT